MAALKYWLWLTTRPGLSVSAIRRLLERFGAPEEIYAAGANEYSALGLHLAEIAALKNKSMRGPEQIIKECERLGIFIATCQDAWYPMRLLNIYNSPFVLYGRGKRILIDEEAAVGIVGARECSPYGRKVAGSISYRLAQNGMLVISGLARGIDTAAVLGALKANAPVVGVLGCGLDVVYPKENKAVYEMVAENGLLLSEYPPGTRPLSRHFPLRNRIISGLSLGVVVVEGRERSGALITARHALEQGRDVFAVPGNIDSPLSAAPNRLLREGAIPLVSWENVAQEYINLYSHRIRPPAAQSGGKEEKSAREAAGPEPRMKKKEVDKSSAKAYIDLQEHSEELTKEQQDVLRALSDQAQAVHVDELMEAAGLPVGRILSALTVLEIKGLIKQHPGKIFESCVLIKT
ncbi:MAG: DNA-processing protein DprA [Oscillospiraceae bacterium]|nr:DNA-processing protein DprA [Oscillospiraceae bacterium]